MLALLFGPARPCEDSAFSASMLQLRCRSVKSLNKVAIVFGMKPRFSRHRNIRKPTQMYPEPLKTEHSNLRMVRTARHN